MSLRRAGALLAFSAVGAAVAAAQQRPDTTGPRVQHYAFYVTLPDSGVEIRGTAVISISFPARRVDTLRLDLVGMQVDSVNELLSMRPLPFDYDGTALRIALPAAPAGVAVPLGAPWAIRVVWHGAPRDGLIIQPNARGRWAAFGDNWPERARDWIPTVDDPAHKVTVRWTVSAPSGLQVVANGRLERRTAAAGGRTVWWYSEDHPIPTYTMVIGATRMTVSERHRRG